MKAIRIMKKGLFAGLILITSLAWGQSLEEDADYKQLLAMEEEARAALAEGDYDKAYQLSQEGRQTSSLLYERFRAKKYLKEAEKRIVATKTYKGDKHHPDLYNQAVQDYEQATKAYDKQEYPTTIELSEKIVALLDEILPALVAAAAKENETPVFPRFYKVRLIPQARDCFWTIASYPFIYNNGLQWKLLYEANKHKIPDQANPDLILPGAVFEIPSLKGEKREGTYDPKKTYPAIKP